MPLEHDLVTAINGELMRIEAGSGPADEFLERLRRVPSCGGAEGVRTEFSQST
jgi:hypothetical protein